MWCSLFKDFPMRTDRLLLLAERLETMDERLWDAGYYTSYYIDGVGMVGCAAARCGELWPDVFRLSHGGSVDIQCDLHPSGMICEAMEIWFELSEEQLETVFDFHCRNLGRSQFDCARAIRDLLGFEGLPSCQRTL